MNKEHMTCEKLNMGQTKISPLLGPGESFYTNMSAAGYVSGSEKQLKTPEQYVAELMQTKQFTSVRIIENGAFATDGQPIPDSVAIVVVRAM